MTTTIETINGEAWRITRDAAGRETAREMHNPAADAVVVVEVTMRQARRALHAAGHLAAVDAAIDALTEPARSVARIDWDYSNSVRRDNATMAALAAALGLSGAQVDALFAAARAIEP